MVRSALPVSLLLTSAPRTRTWGKSGSFEVKKIFGNGLAYC
jgi:hypothetical protein